MSERNHQLVDHVVGALFQELELAAGHLQEILVDLRKERIALLQVFGRLAQFQFDGLAAHKPVAENPRLGIVRNLEFRLDRKFHDHLIRPFRIEADIADRPHLITFDQHGGRRLQAVHLIVYGIVMHRRREQIPSLKEIDPPIQRRDHQYPEKAYLKFSAQFQFHA